MKAKVIYDGKGWYHIVVDGSDGPKTNFESVAVCEVDHRKFIGFSSYWDGTGYDLGMDLGGKVFEVTEVEQ